MTTEARIGHGLRLRILDETLSPDAFVDIGEITSLDGPSIAVDAVDVTHTQSSGSGSPPVADGWREFIPGLADGGEVSGEVNFVPGSTGTALLLSKIRQAVTGQIVVPGDSPPATWDFSAILTAFEVSGPVDDKMAASFTFKISGQPVLTAS